VRARWAKVDEAAEKALKERTLTKLYNQRPAWLALLHEQLDRQVLAAYPLPDDISDAKSWPSCCGLTKFAPEGLSPLRQRERHGERSVRRDCGNHVQMIARA
jgi:hypothetical protein